MAKDAKYRYYRISPRIWAHALQHQWSADTQILALYLLTSPHRNIAGLYRLPKAYLVEDLGWTMERLTQPLAELLGEGFVEYDEDARVILIVKSLEYDAPANENQVTGVIKQLSELPATPLLTRLQRLSEQFCKPLAQPLAELITQRNGNSGSISIAIASAATVPSADDDETVTPDPPRSMESPTAHIQAPADEFDAAEAWVSQQLGKAHLGSGDWPALKSQLAAAGTLENYQRIVARVLRAKKTTDKIGSVRYFDGAVADWQATHSLPASRSSPGLDDEGQELLRQSAQYASGQ